MHLIEYFQLVLSTGVVSGVCAFLLLLLLDTTLDSPPDAGPSNYLSGFVICGTMGPIALILVSLQFLSIAKRLALHFLSVTGLLVSLRDERSATHKPPPTNNDPQT